MSPGHAAGVRITLVVETFLPVADSTTTTAKAVLDRLVDTGHAAQVVTTGPGLPSYRGCPVVRLRPLDRFGAQVGAALDAFRPDLVHVSSPGTIGRAALRTARRRGLPTVVLEQSALRDVPLEAWHSRVVERADTVLVSSAWMQDRLARQSVDVGVWLPGVDRAAYTPALRDEWLHDRWARARSLPQPLVVVGYVGSLRNRNDVRRLADLARIPGIRPVVVGDGPQRAWLDARLPGAKLLGAISTSDLTAVLPSFDLLVHPGTQETCAHTLRQAAAAGVPVVAPRAGAVPEVVRHLETGLLYDPDDPAGLQRTVATVAGDRRRALLGLRARELATRTWAGAVDELVDRHYRPLVVRARASGRAPAGNGA
jgi:phosphatidylinositol alpha 1,6-mannosyltransferase